MNYFEHHIGDFAQATMHLSFVEDAAYHRLIRKYYADERPIPADLKAAQRLVGARSKEEREAVDTVLQEFFELRDDGWHQARCDREIARFHEGAPERELKNANEKNRLKNHREERARLFQALTNAGQHAAWNIGIRELRELVSALPATRPETAAATPPATAPATPATATQTPDTRHQAPYPEVTPSVVPSSGKTRVEASRGSRLPSDWRPSDELIAWTVAECSDLDVDETIERFRDYWTAKPGADGRKASWDATWRNWVRNEKPRTANGAASANGFAPRDEWWKSNPGIDRKGAELNMPARGGESYPAYASRIWDRIREGVPHAA